MKKLVVFLLVALAIPAFQSLVDATEVQASMTCYDHQCDEENTTSTDQEGQSNNESEDN